MPDNNSLGDWSVQTEKTWEHALQFLGRLGREREIVDSAGYDSCIKAATTDQSGDSIAWIETREKETRSGYWDVTHKLKVSQGTDIIAQWELPTYNPFFGCDVGLLQWYGDQIGVVYCEKHETIAAVFDTKNGAKGRLLSFDHDWKCVADVLYFGSEEHGLIETCLFPQLQQGVPISTRVAPEKRQFVPKDKISVNEFVKQVATQLFGDNPPQPIAETLIGAAAYRFWDSWPSPVTSYGFERRWNSPFWIPFYWYDIADNSLRTQLLHLLDDIAKKSFTDRLGDDYAINMATEHVCRSAEIWSNACRSMSLPKDHWCHFWVEWSQTEFQKSLGLFPEGFREVYEQLRQEHRKKDRGFIKRLLGRR